MGINFSKRKKLLFLSIVVLVAFLVVPFKVCFIELTEPELIKAAESGDAKAQRELAGMYLYGQWVGRDYAEAFFWEQASKREPPKWMPPALQTDTFIVMTGGGPRPRAEDHLWPFQKSWIEWRVKRWKQKHPDLPPELPNVKSYQDAAGRGARHAYLFLAKLYEEGAPNLKKILRRPIFGTHCQLLRHSQKLIRSIPKKGVMKS